MKYWLSNFCGGEVLIRGDESCDNVLEPDIFVPEEQEWFPMLDFEFGFYAGLDKRKREIPSEEAAMFLFENTK